MSCGPADCGDVPSWIEAVATVLAFIAAGWAVIKTSQLLKIEQGRDRKHDEEDAERRKVAERAEQADLVAAWSHWNDRDGSLVRIVNSGWGALITNSSPLPVYDVNLDCHDPDGVVRASVELPLVTPGQTFAKWPSDVIREGEQRGAARAFRVAIRFRDTAGRVWERDRHGRLTKMTEMRFVDASDTITMTDQATVELGRGGDSTQGDTAPE